MAEQPLSRHDIYSAANSIATQGEMPSIKSIRLHIGRGSEGTILKHLQTWKQDLLQSSKVLKENEMLHALIRDLKNDVSNLLFDGQ